MILVSTETGSKELQAPILKHGIPCEKMLIPGDAAFEGYGPHGMMGVGIERKRLRDMLTCIDDGRFSGHQALKMWHAYAFRFLMIEGEWKPHNESGALMEQYVRADGSWVWGEMRPRTAYAKLRRYLFTVQMAGIHVLFSRNMEQTAYDICELYHWFQKPWHKHTGMLGMHRPTTLPQDGSLISSLHHEPSLVRKWARDLEGIDVVKSADADRVFRSALDLAQADETDWLRVPGVGVQTAQRIVKAIRKRR